MAQGEGGEVLNVDLGLGARLCGVFPCPDCHEQGLMRHTCGACGGCYDTGDLRCLDCGGLGVFLVPCSCGRTPWALRRAMVRDAFARNAFADEFEDLVEGLPGVDPLPDHTGPSPEDW